jgi:hypothetical protein
MGYITVRLAALEIGIISAQSATEPICVESIFCQLWRYPVLGKNDGGKGISDSFRWNLDGIQICRVNRDASPPINFIPILSLSFDQLPFR